MITSSVTNHEKINNEPVPVVDLVLPSAPLVNNKIRFTDSEKPGSAITPAEAVSWIGNLIKAGKEISSVEIIGPGDAMASPLILFYTLDLLRKNYPEIKIGLTSLGLGGADLAADLAKYAIDRITITVDAVDPEIVKKIYAWVRPGKKTLPLAASAPLLVAAQQESVAALAQAGLRVRIQTTVYPGINDLHIEEIAGKMAGAGASSIVILPFIMADSGEETNEEVSKSCDSAALAAARQRAAGFLELDKSNTDPFARSLTNLTATTNDLIPGAKLPQPTKERPNVAVASSNGMDVDLHLGQARQMLIYGPRDDGLACLLEARQIPEARIGTSRWQALADNCLYDCFALLAANAGEAPKTTLAKLDIKVIISEENIEGTVDVLYGGGKKKRC